MLPHLFGHYYPVIIDCETSGIDAQTNALLEIAYVTLSYQDGVLQPLEKETFHVIPFEGAAFNPESMKIHQIDPGHPFRFAQEEKDVLLAMNAIIDGKIQQGKFRRAVLVGHNAWFDLAFLNQAYKRHNIKSSFHRFTSFDTATLGAFFAKETVLAKALTRAQIPYNPKEAHGALYDAEQTALLFCHYWNRFAPSKFKK
jgi:ribonuclease T